MRLLISQTLVMIAIILFLMSFTYINFKQNEVAIYLDKRIKCLEQGRVFAFDNFCVVMQSHSF